ncbi:MAG: aldo/keto reductase [Acidobacteriota bacterium]|nr:aldo/keto reductase [Acidobacteriota bacterium]
MKRRTFVAGLIGGTLAGMGRRSARAGSGEVKPGDIPKRVFGKTGEKLTVVGQAGGRFPLISDREAIAVTRRAVDLGINYFDTAHSYWNGHSEEIYGEVLPQFRRQVFITTKSVKRTRREAEAELHLSLKRLRTDYVDLWQVHSVSELDEIDRILGPGGAMEAFEAAKKAGKCRFIGFTGHRDPHVHVAMLKAYPGFDTILMPLHIADPAYLSFENHVLPLAIEQNLGIQGMKNFANAKLLQSFSAAECLNYVLSLPIHCTTVGCTTLGQLEDDVRIARKFSPYSPEQMASLRRRAQGIKGPGLEDWKRDVEVRAGMVRRPPYLGG